MDVLTLSRLQFAATTFFHFLFVPLVIAYQVWAYILFKDKLTGEDTAHY